MIKKKKKYHIAIAGATGAVGRKMLEILEERNFPVDDLKLFASTRSAGKFLESKGEKIAVANAKMIINNILGVVLALAFFPPEILTIVIVSLIPWNAMIILKHWYKKYLP